MLKKEKNSKIKGNRTLKQEQMQKKTMSRDRINSKLVHKQLAL